MRIVFSTGGDLYMGEYTTADVANIVDIAKPTVNKYSLALERAGYRITKNEKGNRIYTDDDIEMLQKVKVQSDTTKMPISRIVDMIISEQKRNTIVEETGVLNSTTLKKNDTEIGDTLHIPEEFKDFFRQELKTTKDELREEMKQEFQNVLEDKLQQRERDEELRRITQAAKEAAIAKEKENEKKGTYFSRLWNSLLGKG